MISAPTTSPADRGWITALSRLARKRSVILGYHGVDETERKDDLFMLQVAPAKFRAQLELLRTAGFRFVTVAELARQISNGSPPPGLAALSFDDAMRNNLTVALPILRELDIRATVYVATDWVGGRSPWIGPGGDGSILSEGELVELARAGWELGAHTCSHADLSTLDYRACRDEIERSCEELGRIAGVEVQTFAYPFGYYGPEALAAVRDLGLLAAVTTGSGSWDRYELTRAMIGAADPMPVVWLKLTDRYEPLLRTPPLRLVRHASKRLRARLDDRRKRRGDEPTTA